jgi:bifunctional ADP-heptose synthase (sugar kinase/adenylyltransferase)
LFLVIGESCLDVFVYGESNRLAPEAPAPVFIPKEQKQNPGMAKNVQRNIEALGFECDLVTNDNWKEITKTRFIHKSTNQMFIRVDSGDSLVERINLTGVDLKKYKIVIISDYCKGFLSEEDISYIASRHDCVFLDTKKTLGPWCDSVNYIKINNIEYEKTKHMISKRMREKMVITLGPNGCQYKEKIFPVDKVEIKDVSGAGDTFLAGLVTKFYGSGDIEKASIFANECATIVVQKKGVTTV